VCVNGSWVELCAKILSGSAVGVATVAGFPLGAMTSSVKALQAAELVMLGADEIDMVAPIGRIIDGDWGYLEKDIAGVVEAAGGRLVKVILETAALDSKQIVVSSGIAKAAGAQFVKTSTGFHPAGGATEYAVALLHATVGDKLGVKAAGGIRDRETALRMIAAGATRIGTSCGFALVKCVGDGRLVDLLADPDEHLSVRRNVDLRGPT
jgi:deoxyribose-phosphate aldolase